MNVLKLIDGKKKCTACREIKELSEFSFGASNSLNIKPRCKICDNKLQRQYRKTREGLILTIYHNQRMCSKHRGMEMPQYSKKELQDYLLNSDKYNQLYREWVRSGYQNKYVPSCDRIDETKGYSLDNIQIVTWEENDKRASNDVKKGIRINNPKPQKPVLQFTDDKELIGEYVSQSDAARVTGVSQPGISACCRGINLSGQAGGFIWKFKEN